MAFYKYRPWHRASDFGYFGTGSLYRTNHFIYSFIIVKEIICEVLMVTTWIMGEIWVLLFLRITLKIARLQYQNYFYFYIVADAMLNYQPVKFGYNRETHYRDMDKIDRNYWLEAENRPSVKAWVYTES